MNIEDVIKVFLNHHPRINFKAIREVGSFRSYIISDSHAGLEFHLTFASKENRRIILSRGTVAIYEWDGSDKFIELSDPLEELCTRADREFNESWKKSSLQIFQGYLDTL